LFCIFVIELKIKTLLKSNPKINTQVKKKKMKAKNLKRSLTAVIFIMIMVQCCSISQAQNAKIKYASFNVEAANNKIMIYWVTDRESPTNYFEIQRSQDGKNFKTIEMVLGPDPKLNSCKRFAGTDKPSNNKQKLYYRLKHVNVDGTEEFGDIAALSLHKKI
jgi:hypothetical protein